MAKKKTNALMDKLGKTKLEPSKTKPAAQGKGNAGTSDKGCKKLSISLYPDDTDMIKRIRRYGDDNLDVIINQSEAIRAALRTVSFDKELLKAIEEARKDDQRGKG